MTLRIFPNNPGILHVWTTLCHTAKTSKDYQSCENPTYFKLTRLLDRYPDNSTRFTNHRDILGCANIRGKFRRTTRSLHTRGYYPFSHHTSGYNKAYTSTDITEIDQIVNEIAKDHIGRQKLGNDRDASVETAEPPVKSIDSNSIVNSWIPIPPTSKIFSPTYLILEVCLLVCVLGMCCLCCRTFTRDNDDIKLVFKVDHFKHQQSTNDQRQHFPLNISQNNHSSESNKTLRQDKKKYSAVGQRSSKARAAARNTVSTKVTSPTIITMDSEESPDKASPSSPARADLLWNIPTNTYSNNKCQCQQSMIKVRAIPALAVLPNSTLDHMSSGNLQPTVNSNSNQEGFGDMIFPTRQESLAMWNSQMYIPSSSTLSTESWYDFES